MSNRLVSAILIPAAMVILIVLLCGLPWQRAPEKGKLVVGFIAPLSGPRASIGEDARAAAELSRSEIAQSLHARNQELELRFEDSAGDPAKGVAAFNKLVLEGAAVVITQNSNVSLPISALANRSHVVQLAITTTSDRFTTPKDYVFRLNGPTTDEAKLMASYLASRDDAGGSGVGIIVMQDEYPQMLHQHLLTELSAAKQPVVSDDAFLPSESDFRTLIGKLKQRGAGRILCLGYQVQCGLFVKQLRQLGVTPALILVNTPVNNREFFTTAGMAAEGVIVTYPQPNLEAQGARHFLERVGRPMNFFSSNAFDAVQLVAATMKDCEGQLTSECMEQGFNQNSGFVGVSGAKHFNENGDMQDNYTLMVAKNGAFEVLKP